MEKKNPGFWAPPASYGDDVRQLRDDLREAERLGPKLARLTDGGSKLDAAVRGGVDAIREHMRLSHLLATLPTDSKEYTWELEWPDTSPDETVWVPWSSVIGYRFGNSGELFKLPKPDALPDASPDEPFIVDEKGTP